MTVLKTEQLTKQFGGLTAVDDVDLDIEQGEFVASWDPTERGNRRFSAVSDGIEPTTARSRPGRFHHGMDPHEVVREG